MTPCISYTRYSACHLLERTRSGKPLSLTIKIIKGDDFVMQILRIYCLDGISEEVIHDTKFPPLKAPWDAMFVRVCERTLITNGEGFLVTTDPIHLSPLYDSNGKVVSRQEINGHNLPDRIRKILWDEEIQRLRWEK